MNGFSMGKRWLRGCCVLLALFFAVHPFQAALAEEKDEAVVRVLIDDGTIAKGVRVAALDVSQKKPAEALQLLQEQNGGTAGDAALILSLPDRAIEVPVSDLGATPQLDKAVGEAMLVGRSGGISDRIWDIKVAKYSGMDIGVCYAYDEEALRAKITSIADAIPRETLEGSFAFDPDSSERFQIVEGYRGFTPDTEGLVAAAEAALTSGELAGVPVPGTPAEDKGEEILKQGTAANTVLVGKFTTTVAGSSGRRANVRTGTEMINGIILQPGEMFSVNDTLGPRNGAAGIWSKAPALLDGKTVMEYGGGLCQVSSTLFNAVARADLQIDEWVHHSIPSSYVTIGCDATVSTGGPDFKFTNNTEWPVYIVYHYDDGTRKLTCEIWGRPLPDGQYIEITGKQVGTRGMPSTRYTDDPEEVVPGRIGRYSETYQIWYSAEGEELRRILIHENYYPARAPVQLKPTPTSAPTPAP